MIFRKLAATALMLAGVMVLPAVAMAANAFTTGTVNVRSGPGTNYARIATLPAGTSVDVRRCEVNWCNILRSGLRGWVSANFLSGYSGPSYRPPVVIVPPPIVVRPPHHRPPHWNQPPSHRPPHWNRPPAHRPHQPRPPRPRPPSANCKIAPGHPCPR